LNDIHSKRWVLYRDRSIVYGLYVYFIFQLSLPPFCSFLHIQHGSHVSCLDHIPTGSISIPFLLQPLRTMQPEVCNNLEIRYRQYK